VTNELVNSQKETFFVCTLGVVSLPLVAAEWPLVTNFSNNTTFCYVRIGFHAHVLNGCHVKVPGLVM